MAVSSPHIAVREDWLALEQEEALFPGMPIVDPHHHLWDRPGHRHLFDELLADARQGHRIQATVFVQSRSMYNIDQADDLLKPVGEVEFANGVAARSASGLYGSFRACAGIVGSCDLMAGDRIEAVLDRMMGVGGGRFRGIRNQTAWHEDPEIATNPVPPVRGLLLKAAFRDGARRLGARGLTLDVWAYHTQLEEFEDLARACPDTTIILDHLGGPLGAGPYRGRREEVLADWRASMKRIAELPNVCVKLGGLAMGAGGFDFHLADRPPASDLLAAAWDPYISFAIERFGTQRCMFESNFPVDKGMVSYRSLWNAFKRLTKGFSASEKQDLFFSTAARVYNLGIKPEGEF
ncbi:putative TIM-barrel fold metal-dependent hydrolase [Rhizobium binae]|uniref:TIM-barrel fold metal-dependent hydrolase n=1 Tax=Rhizobium binae TaxID=1138190 RepID=A0ABV2MR11_9HYPH|nr:amidohydrolase family protein [Rhizobium binae]MBX4994824.1 amidohydrolase family protein [Rhizobium binae]NKL51993.1 amidohydrolase family protein [Rhizobium leguminosarum bv. viciae]QSY85352.1 amidohydrolase family protein [Rhizobium binae]